MWNLKQDECTRQCGYKTVGAIHELPLRLSTLACFLGIQLPHAVNVLGYYSLPFTTRRIFLRSPPYWCTPR